VNLEQSETVLGVEENVHIKYNIPPREELLDKQPQGILNCKLPKSPQEWVSLGQSDKAILIGIK
jgi:6-phosphogluconolactonase/glucosamine-6-phosphate isomerase/deaminase